MNKVMLIGRICKDIDVRYGNDTAVAKFSLAVNRIKKNETDFISCVSFGKTAETIGKYLKKGSQVGIEGHIQTGSYTNKDGAKVYTTDVIVENITFCSSSQENESNPGAKNAPPSFSSAADEGFMKVDEIDDGMPFR